MCDSADDGNDELADRHAERPPEEKWSAPYFLNGPEGDRGREYVDEGCDERD